MDNIEIGPDPNLPDWFLYPSTTAMLSHRLAARGFLIKGGLFHYAEDMVLAAGPAAAVRTLDQFIIQAKQTPATVDYAVAMDAHSGRIEVWFRDDECYLRSDSVDVKQLMEVA